MEINCFIFEPKVIVKLQLFEMNVSDGNNTLITICL